MDKKYKLEVKTKFREDLCPWLLYTNLHQCYQCHSYFQCWEGWMNMINSPYIPRQECCHQTLHSGVDRFFCSAKCITRHAGRDIFYLPTISEDRNEYLAKMNFKKLCECDLPFCCNEENGCWSPRQFILDD